MSGREKTVAFTTLGCKLNQFESYDMERQFVSRGYRVIPFTDKASIYVVNTCTVTAKSDCRCRQSIRKARRRNPDATVVAIGCYAQTQPGALAGMPEVDFVLGNSEKGDVLSGILSADRVRVADLERAGPAPFGDILHFGTHTRAFVKIQDGCDSRCTYCIVPLARGPNRSRDVEEVASQVEQLGRRGYREIVLTGVHLGTWGRDLTPSRSLESLLARLIELPAPGRLRLSSIEPTEFTPELIDMLSSERICPHLHIPLQSGASAVLRRMGRPYDPGFYAGLVDRLVTRLPDLGLGADIIAGFPGEGDREFAESLSFVAGLPLSYLHVFPYSKRPGTAAAGFSGEVPSQEKEERAAELRRLGRRKADAFRRRRIGRTYDVIVEGRRAQGNGMSTGLTGNYLKVLIPDRHPPNSLRAVRLTRLDHAGRLYGETVSQD